MAQSLEQLEAQKAKYQAKIRQLEASERKLKRKQDAHNKIVVGATIMATVPDIDLTDEAVRNAFCNFIRNQHQNGWIGKWIDKELATATSVDDKPNVDPEPTYRHAASVDEVDRILGVGLFDDDDDELEEMEDPGIDDDD